MHRTATAPLPRFSTVSPCIFLAEPTTHAGRRRDGGDFRVLHKVSAAPDRHQVRLRGSAGGNGQWEGERLSGQITTPRSGQQQACKKMTQLIQIALVQRAAHPTIFGNWKECAGPGGGGLLEVRDFLRVKLDL